MQGAPGRRIYCNRTLNLRSIKAIGYDMDYTLIHYRTNDWEAHAYKHTLRFFREQGWPVEGLEFDPQLMIRGLTIDTQLGNIVKANRFGFVKHAYHGTRLLPHEETREIYGRVIVDLEESRFMFMNTLFSLSEASLYAQFVDRFDRKELSGVVGYEDLYRKVRYTVDYAHLEGRLKGEIIADPDRFVELDPDTPMALLDQHHAGKKLVLITNSEWHYSKAMMSYAFDRFLPHGMSWTDLFDLVIVEARKPNFFTQTNPAFRVDVSDGTLVPAREGFVLGSVFLGGHASQVESCLGLAGEEILYVGDHLFADVHVSKNVQRWRTALVLREVEAEIAAIEAFEPRRLELDRLMADKERLEAESYDLKLQLQRMRLEYGIREQADASALKARLDAVRERLQVLDQQIRPLAAAADVMLNPNWGLLMRAGNDKSQLARQVEQYADIYMSRVSNFVFHTPFAYLRGARGTLPHDPYVVAEG
ncbi:MAG: HAD-IG family 5'-nucleotidase [Myxococcales bacterium]|nr:HAD-IG family 5'-nucleotidase [Myxococcales bacterium]